MLCAKCHQNEATVHFTTIVDGAKEETFDLCKDCAPPTGFDFDKLDPKQIEALSVVGKKCEFCDKQAVSGELHVGGRAIYWCFDCGLERNAIIRDLLVTERPDLLQGSKTFLSFCSDTGLQAWSASASQRATQALKQRKRQNGSDSNDAGVSHYGP